MRITIPKLNISTKYFIKKCGYLEIQNPHKNYEISYARSLNPGRFYPRFHIYLEENLDQTRINLHLDAKKPSYEGTAAHGGEYNGQIVEREMERIKKKSAQFIYNNNYGQSLGFQPEKSFWEKIESFFHKQ